jgi:hypothetical protein
MTKEKKGVIPRGKVIVAVMVALLLGGCSAPVSQLRQNEAHLTLSSINHPKEVARCIELRTRAEMGGTSRLLWKPWQPLYYVTLEEHPDNTYHVVLTVPSGAGLEDILVKPSGSGSVIECRRVSGWSGEEHVLEIVEQCVRQTGGEITRAGMS